MHARQGFTLVELSVVLLVIALIVGGTLVGQSLIRQSQIRAMLGEYDSYLKSIKEFQDKYRALPGDFPTAISNWSTGGGITVANGDGNGTIGVSSAGGALSSQTEWYQAWAQLSLAGLISGRYTGVTSGSGVVINTNVPASKLPNSGWTLFYFLYNSSSTNFWADNYGHVMTLGPNNGGSYTAGNAMNPGEMFQMDQKMDDGMPGTGKIRSARTPLASGCTNDTTQAASTYQSTSQSMVCWPMFLLGI